MNDSYSYCTMSFLPDNLETSVNKLSFDMLTPKDRKVALKLTLKLKKLSDKNMDKHLKLRNDKDFLLLSTSEWMARYLREDSSEDYNDENDY